MKIIHVYGSHAQLVGLKTKIIRTMKITMVLLWMGLMTTYANTYSQVRINIDIVKGSLPELFQQIQQQSDYLIIYKDDFIKLNKQEQLNLKLKDKTVNEVLNAALQGSNLTYKISGRQIAIVGRDKNQYNRFLQDTLINIRGRIYDTHEPPGTIPGVSIRVKNSTTGALSDADGYFNITAKKNDVLVFSIVGFKSREYTITRSEKSLILSLSEDVAVLDQVVVTGMSEQQKKHIASSLSTLDIKSNIEGKPITSLSQALQGGVTGIDVRQGSGLPGGDAAAIKIRGITTLNNSDALILVDGIPMDMNHIDPVTVESVTVLKDAAAAAIYGARAANGVILVTTKRGTPGRVSVTYDAYAGAQSPNKIPDFVDAPTYMRMYNVAMVNSGGQPLYSEQDIAKTLSGEDPINYPNTDWAKEVIKPYSAITSHSLSVSGGNELARFAVTGNYLFQDGMIPLNNASRYNLRANTSISLGKKFLVYLDVLAIKRNTLYPNRANSNGGNRILDDMYRLPPTVLPKYPEQEGRPTIYGRYADIVNPVAYAEKGGTIKYEFAQTNINLQPKWEVFPGFNLRGQLSFRLNSDVYKQERDNFYFFDYYTNQLVQTWAVQRDAYSQTRDTYYYLSGTADYSLNYEKHRLFAIGGYSMETFNNGYYDISSIVSGFAKVNYSYDDKYLLEGSIRLDGSSKFGPGNKYGYFPSVALGWNVHNEDFFKNLNLVKSLKLRGSYGQLGNESIGLYQYQNLIDASTGLENSWGNPNISWEKVNMLDIGADIGLLKDNSLTLTVDYYNKVTNDIILSPVVSLVGAVGKAPLNAGSLKNTGWEATLTYNKSLGKDFNISFRPGVTYNKNVVTSLPGGELKNGININRVGYALGSYWGYKSDGLLQASDFNADGSAKIPVVTNAGPGDIKYLDISGDGFITDADQDVMGDPNPRLNYFANMSVSWKKFDFEILVQGIGANDYSANIAGKSSGYLWNPLNFDASGGVPTNYRAANTWRPNNTGASLPRLLANPGRNVLYSDFWLFNGAYTRVKFIQLGYRLESQYLKKAGIQSARFYLNAQNPFTFTSLEQADPESGGGSWTYGIMKTFTFGVHVGF
jgi:TonB-linked SusC/RagA family outer membrane protein